jgi:hypothetical protein
MSDCDQVRQHKRLLGAECCVRCHQAQELSELVLKGVGYVRVCCSVAAMLHPLDVEQPTRPYGLDDVPSEKIALPKRPV